MNLVLAALAGTTAFPSVPFTYVHHEIVVDVSINGSGPYHMLLDTDTEPSAIDAALAKRLHMLPIGASGAGSGEGSAAIAVYPVRADNVVVGGAHQLHLDALVTDLSGISAALHMQIDGVLGTSFLKGRVVQIDYPCHLVHFLPDAVLAPFAAHFVSGADGNASDDLYVGSQRVTATFDTGDSGSSYVPRAGIERLGLQTAAHAGRQSSGRGYRGITQVTEGELKDVRIGKTPIGTVSTRFNQSSTAGFDVNIGNRVLERFIATFDYQRGLLTLESPRICS